MVKLLDDKEIRRLSKLSIQEKLQNGDWYKFAEEPLLQKSVVSSVKKVQEINDQAKKDLDAAKEIFYQFVPHFSKTAQIMFPLSGIEYPENLRVGPGSFINAYLQVISAGNIRIGENTFVGPNCQLYTANHHVTSKVLRREAWQYDSPVTIGDDCWLGGMVIVLPGITIGDGVVIGAGSVVTKDVPNNCLIAGNPARIIRYL